MKIFIASGIFHPDSGGPATYLYRLLPALQARGHAIRVLTFGDPTADDALYPYPLTRVSLHQPLITRQRAYLERYRAEAAQADLIYINSLSLPRGGDRGRPRVLKIVGDHAWERSVNRGWLPATEDIDQFQRKRYNPLLTWLKAARAHESRTVDRVIVPSDYLRRMVVGWGAPAERVQVIYNALEADQYAPTFSSAEARQQLGLDPHAPYLMTAARLTAWKGVDLLLEALARCAAYRLIVIGDGPQQAALQAQAARLGIADRVQFLGKVPHEKVALVMRAVDYFVLYSGYEGLSHTILEALSAGTPVIASARGGNPEVIHDGVNGLLVAHPSVDALAEALQRALVPGTRERLAANVGQGMDRFVWQNLVDQTISALEQVAARYTRQASPGG